MCFIREGYLYSGDIGEAICSLTCKETLQNLENFNQENCQLFVKIGGILTKSLLDEYCKEYKMHEDENSKEFYEELVQPFKKHYH